VSVEELDWRKPSIESSKFDLVLASDVVWLSELVGPLVDCIRKLLNGSNVMLLAHQQRSAGVDAEFFDCLTKKGLAFEKIDFDDATFATDKIQLWRITNASIEKKHLLVLIHGFAGAPRDFRHLLQ
jgi:hypothetical protein